MSGTLKAGAIIGPETSLNLMEGFTKSWWSFDGTSTVALYDTFNTTSLTDNGTGSYSIALTNAMSNAEYSPLSGGNRGATNVGWMNAVVVDASHVDHFTTQTAGTVIDHELVAGAVLGDLA